MSKKIKDHAIAFFTIVIWGITFICTKDLEQHFSALQILFIRYFVAYIVLWILCPRPLLSKSVKEEGYFFAAALSGAALYQYLENLSVSYTSPASVSFITSIAPLFTALLASRFLGEKFTFKNFAGMVISLAGVFLICFGDSKTIETGLWGDLIILCSIWLWAMYSVIVKKIAAFGHHQFQVTRRLFFYSLICMLPFMLFGQSRIDFAAFTGYNIVNLLFLGVFASAICFATWNRSVEALGATTTSKYLFVMPVITLAAQSIYSKSSIGIAALSGMFVVLLGIGISEFGKK